jgi:hypothetical protein
VLLWWLGVAACPAQSTPDYDRDVQPILADLCFACHGADSAAREADLRLDQRDAAIESGAIVEGQPDESSLIERIETADPDLIMPPPKTKKSLTAAQKELLRRWVASGAVYQPHWSFSVPVQPALPAVREESWLKNPIDRFVLARLETHGLQPAPPADARTLFRRLHLDITGLPPAPDDVQRFESDYQQQPEAALSDWIDRLMKTPAWGEHRARYWLDAARYGDTHGLHFDNYREMWVYRDWVIRAFNRNQPFDQFVIEQLAGDLLSQPTEEQLIATGFQRCNITTNEGGTIDEENLANYAADRVQTFGWVFLGLTTNCGQCHDHKFDPFSMRDYYSLAAFFRNTTQGAKDGNVADGLGPVIVVPGEADQARWHALPDEIAAAISSRDARREQARGEFDTWLQSATPESIGQDVPTDQLVLHLPLNEGQGNEVRGLGLAEPVRSPGELGWDKDGRSGPAPIIKPGSTLDLGGAGDFERDQAFSYAAWVKPAAANTQAAILARMDEKAGHRGWDLWQNGQAFGAHLIDSWPANGMKVVTRDNVVKPGQWQHVLVSYDGSGKPEGVKIYIDGNEAATRVENNTLQAAASIRTSTPLRIGQRSEGAVFDGGAVQDVRLYGRQLSGREAQAIAQHAALLNLLVVAADKRTPEQNQQLYDHYLGARDAQYPALAAAVTALEGEREAIRARSPVTHIQRERPDAPAMANILMRGAYDKPGEQVPAATPEALHPLPEGAAANRLGLAQWVVDPHNPLTARVTVNRFWQEVFGQGIVVTAEDFGTMGSAPSHPELLDWLAVEFQNSGWDVRQLFQLILTSATYRQAAIATPEKLEKDRDNTLLSRGPRFRMDAEMVRDGALSASGLLSAKMYGPGTRPYQPEGIWDIVGLPGGNTRDYVQDQGENLYRRTLYTFWKRMAPPPSLETFNAPSREVCVVRRERTNTPLQALVTLNDPQFMEAARHLAQQAILQCPDDFNERLRFVSLRLLARELNPAEQQIARASFDDLAAHYGSHPEHAGQLIHYGDSPPSGQVDAQTLAAWTMLVNQLMNLDETLNK